MVVLITLSIGNAQSCSIDIFPASESLEETQLSNSEVKAI
jgi:hypothetical protein